MENQKAMFTCPSCGFTVEYQDGAPQPLICPRCQRPLRAMTAPGSFDARFGERPPQLPPQPVTRIKRRVSYEPQPHKAGKPTLRSVLIVIAISILIPTVFLLLGLASYQSGQSYCQPLPNNGRTVSATVTELKMEIPGEDNPNYVYYRFPASVNGDPTTINSRQGGISWQFFSSHKVGDTIEVVYDVSDPSISRIATETGCRGDLISHILPALLVGVFLTGVFLRIIWEIRS